jgi:MFS family permease
MPQELASPENSRNVYAFGATSFFNDTASEMAYWVLPAFLASIGAGPDKLGLIEGIAESIASFAKLFSGLLADRVERRKPIVVSGYFVANAVKPLLSLVTAWWQVLLVRFADRLAKGVRGAPRDVMLTESVPKEKVGAAFGLLQSMDSAGAIAGPLLAIWILRDHGLRDVFRFALIPGAISMLIAFFFIREKGKVRTPHTAADFKPEPDAARLDSPTINGATAAQPGMNKNTGLPASFYYVLVVIALFSLGSSSDMFLVLRAQGAGIAPMYAPLLGLVFNVTYTAMSWPAGKLSDKFSRRTVAAAGYVVFAGVYFAFALAPSRAALWGAMATYGLFYALTAPVLKALVSDTVRPELRGRAFGIYYFVTSIATLAASLVTGELWKTLGAPVPFYFSSALAVVAAALLQLPFGSPRTASS